MFAMKGAKTTDDLIQIIEGITGVPFHSANVMYGCLRKLEVAVWMRCEADRLDNVIRRERPPWRETEKDDSIGRPLEDHLEVHERIEAPKRPVRRNSDQWPTASSMTVTPTSDSPTIRSKPSTSSSATWLRHVDSVCSIT